MSEPIYFSFEQIKALYGDQFLLLFYTSNWASEVKKFRLQGDILTPYDADEQPVPCNIIIKVSMKRLTDKEIEFRKQDMLSEWKKYFEANRDTLKCDQLSSFFKKRSGTIQVVGDLLQHTESQMLRYKNMGRKRFHIIKDMLAYYGYGFRKSSSDWE